MAVTLVKTTRLQQIDILRGFAALWVVLSHYLPHWAKYLGPTIVIVPNSFGVYAVELFFVISGFVIFMTLDRCKTVVDFIVLRFSRLYPTYWTTLVVSTLAGLALFGAGLWPSNLLTNATMFQEFVGAPNHDIVFWSLTVEMAFYVNVAWVFAFGLHRSPKRIVAVWLLATCVWALVLKQPAASSTFAGTDPRQWPALWFALDFAPFFSIGIVFFDAMKWGWSERRAAMLALAGVTQWLLGGWTALLVTAVIGTIFWLAVSGRLSFLVSKVLLRLGAISYPLYLCHRNLGYAALDWMHSQQISSSVAVPITILGALALATLITYGVERPALRTIRTWYESRRTAPVQGLQLAP